MADLARRFASNPLVTPADVPPSRPDLTVKCAFNPGAFRYQGRIGMLMRVAEFAPSDAQYVRTPVVDPSVDGGIGIAEFRRDTPGLDCSDPRLFEVNGTTYLTSLSHLRLAWSTDGEHFRVEPKPAFAPARDLETFGIEDARVTELEGTYYLTFTMVSPMGVGVGLVSTTDWQAFHHHGMIIPPHNKDCALFPARIGERYWCLHRPSGVGLGGNYIWLASSPDLQHWGGHVCIATSRPGLWDSQRVGAGAEPILTEAGWLAIYHGCDARSRYCLGALLLDREDPRRVIARSAEPIMEPTAPYEQQGFFGNCVFTNGHVLEDADTVLLYYGASDTVSCGARLSLRAVLASLDLG